MSLIVGIILLALLGRVEPFKLSLKSSHQTSGEEGTYYQQPMYLQPSQLYPINAPAHQQRVIEPEEAARYGTKGGPVQSIERAPIFAPLPQQQQQLSTQQQSLAYVIIRPILPHYQYLAPMRYLQPPQQPIYQQQTRSIKGGAGEDFSLQQEQQRQIGTKTPLNTRDQEPTETTEQTDLLAKGQSKISKLKSSFDKIISKLTFGSTYQVASEELEPQNQGPAGSQQNEFARPLLNAQSQQQQQVQQHQDDIQLTQQEQETIREAEQQEQLKLAEKSPQQQQQQLPLEQHKSQQLEKDGLKQQEETASHEFRREEIRAERKLPKQ